MPSAADILISDATPDAHTFVPQSITPERAVHVDRDSTTSAGQKTLLLGVSPARANRPTDRVNIRLAVPFEYTEDGVVRVRDTARVNIEVILPELMTDTDRADVAAFAKNAMAHATVMGLIEDLEPVY